MIVDAFIFYNELELLLFRLKELDNYVDYFVVVESKMTHSGNNKELFFNNNKHLYKEYMHKIVHIIVDYLPDKNTTSGYKDIDEYSKSVISNFKNTPARIREEYHRNSILNGLDILNLKDDDIVIITDADEIVNPDILIKYKDVDFMMLALEFDLYFYTLNYKFPKIWTSPKIVKYKLLKELTPEDIRLSTNGTVVSDGGWHFTYFFGADSIIDKIKNFSHQEFNNEHFTSKEYVEDCIKNRKYIFGDQILDYIDISDNKRLPKNYKILDWNKKRKYCFLMTSYCDNQQKIDVLLECINNIKNISNSDICLHAHYPLDSNIHNMVNYYLYDSSNPVLKYPEKFITWWRNVYDYILNIYKDDYGYAVLQQWKRGFNFLKNMYDYIIILNYDVIINNKLLNNITNKFNYEGITFLHENGNTISPLLSISTDSKLFDKIYISEYKKVNGFAEDFTKYIFSKSLSYIFKFEDYKDDYYTMIDFDGNDTFKDNKLSNHSSPYDYFNLGDFEFFIGERDNNLNILFYNIKHDLYIKILYYNNIIYDNTINLTYIIIDTKLNIADMNYNELNIYVNSEHINFDIDSVKNNNIL